MPHVFVTLAVPEAILVELESCLPIGIDPSI